MRHFITKKGAVTIPSAIRKKYGLEKGSKIDFVETDEGVLIIPVVPLEKLCGVDRDHKEIVYRMIRELHAEHRGESSSQRPARDDGSLDRDTQDC